MKRENYKRCDTMGFWEDDTGNLETRFRLLIFNIFSFRRTFKSIASHLVLTLSCVILIRARCIKKYVSVSPRNPTGRIVYSLWFLSDNVVLQLCIHEVSTVRVKKP